MQDVFESLDYVHGMAAPPEADCDAPASRAVEETGTTNLPPSTAATVSGDCNAKSTSSTTTSSGHFDFSNEASFLNDIDLVSLIERCEGETELAVEIAEIFFNQGKESCLCIQQRYAANQLDELVFHTVSENLFDIVL